jgi:hypothetical protein
MRELFATIAICGAASFTTSAEAACSCQCVNGKAQALCSSALEIPQPCVQICPPAVPSATILPPVVPPPGTQQCRVQQVLNPYTHQYEAKQVCR